MLSVRTTWTAAAVFVGQAASGLVAIVAAPAIIANAGVEAFGLYSLVVSAQVIVAISDLGIANTVLTELPKALAANDSKRASAVTRHALRLSSWVAAALAAAAAITLAIPVPWASFTGIPTTLERSTSEAFSVVLLCSSFNVLGTVFFKVRQAEGRAAGAFSLQAVGATVGGVLTIVGAQMGFGVPSLVLATLAPPALARLLLAIGIDSLLAVPHDRSAEFGLNQRAAFFFFLQVVAVLAYQVDQLLLGALSDLQEVAKYALVSRPIGAGGLVIVAASTLLWPYLAGAVARCDVRAIRRVLRKCFVLLPTTSMLVGLTCVIFGDPIWRLLGDNRVTPSRALVWGFAVFLLLRSLDAVTSTFLNAIPVVGFQVRTATIMLVGNVTATTLLISRYGAAGAVWGTVLCQVPVVTIPYLLRSRAELRNIGNLILPPSP